MSNDSSDSQTNQGSAFSVSIHNEDDDDNNNNNSRANTLSDSSFSKELSKSNLRPSLRHLPSHLPANATLGTKAMLMVADRAEKRRTASFELILHILFSVCFITIVLLQRSVYGSYQLNKALNTVFIGEKYESMETWEDLSNYMTNVLAPAFDNDRYYSGKPFMRDESLYMLYNNRLAGGLRLRQLRVMNNKCAVPNQMKSIVRDCYAEEYGDSTKDTRPFGPAHNTSKYTYTEEDDSGSVGIWGYSAGWYEGGGYIVDVPLYSNFSEKIQELIADNWWDQGTRAIIITINIVNPALDARVAVLYLLVEMPAGGTIVPAYVTKAFRLNLYLTDVDYFRAVLEFFFILFLIYWWYAEFMEAKKLIRKKINPLWYFADMWNLLELINLAAFTTAAFMYMAYIGSHERSNIDLEGNRYFPELEQLASKAINLYNISAFNIVITSFRTFKYLRLNDRLFMIWKALRLASGDLSGFLLMFFIMLLGFILSGMLTFGPDTELFNTFANSFGSCWNFVMGNPPDPAILFRINRVLGPAFFALFTIFIFFVLVNMFIAILSDSFAQVRKQSQSKGLKHAIKKKSKHCYHTVASCIDKKRKNLSLKDLIRKIKDQNIWNKVDLTPQDIKQAIDEEITDHQAEELIQIHRKFRSSTKLTNIPLEEMGESSSKRLRASTQLPPVDDQQEIQELRKELSDVHRKLDHLTNLLQIMSKRN